MLHGKVATIVIILKSKKPPKSPESYRPISQLNTLGKLLENIMEARILQFSIHSNIIPSIQHGFCLKCCTHTLLLKVHTLLIIEINAKNCHCHLFRHQPSFRFSLVQISKLPPKPISLGMDSFRFPLKSQQESAKPHHFSSYYILSSADIPIPTTHLAQYVDDIAILF